tara:strand:- start:186 stop:638 length:453 start_codon:yes stop_codon:yes gene_type:complete
MIGYIYKILVHDKIYIGSTKNINRRRRDHNKNLQKNILNYNIYKYARQHSITTLKLTILDKNNYNDKNDLLWIERYYIEKYDSMMNGLNMCLPIYTSNEQELILKIKNIYDINLPMYKLYILIYKHNNIYNKIMYIILKSIQQNIHKLVY